MVIQDKHWAGIRKILVVVLCLNWLVAVFKLVFGYMIKSHSMVADGYHSFSDGASNIIGLIGVWYASFPRDTDHPYGHKKYETFASIGIAILLFLVCFNILHESFSRLSNPVIPEVTLWGFIIMAVTMLINFGVMRFEYKKGRLLNSDILVSDSMHTRADILTSLTVIAAFIFIKMGYPIADIIFATIIALFIGYAGLGILRDSSKVLCDEAVINPGTIKNIVTSTKGVLQCHNIRTRGRKDDIYIDLHVLVDDDMPVKMAHQISYAIEDNIKRQIDGVSDVVVHIEPISSQKEDRS